VDQFLTGSQQPHCTIHDIFMMLLLAQLLCK